MTAPTLDQPTDSAQHAEDATLAGVTAIKPARQSRASRSAAQAKTPKPAAKTPKPAAGKPAKPTPKPTPKPAPAPQGPTTTAQKQAVTQWSVNVLAAALAKSPPKGVSASDAAEWLGQWLNYFPGVRQQKVTFPPVFGEITNAGAAKTDK